MKAKRSYWFILYGNRNHKRERISRKWLAWLLWEWRGVWSHRPGRMKHVGRRRLDRHVNLWNHHRPWVYLFRGFYAHTFLEEEDLIIAYMRPAPRSSPSKEDEDRAAVAQRPYMRPKQQ